jgi:hypothetical protein
VRGRHGAGKLSGDCRLRIRRAAPADGGHVEVDFSPNPLRKHIVAGVFRTLRRRCLRLPEKPGIGVEDMDMAELAEFLGWHAELRL